MKNNIIEHLAEKKEAKLSNVDVNKIMGELPKPEKKNI